MNFFIANGILRGYNKNFITKCQSEQLINYIVETFNSVTPPVEPTCSLM